MQFQVCTLEILFFPRVQVFRGISNRSNVNSTFLLCIERVGNRDNFSFDGNDDDFYIRKSRIKCTKRLSNSKWKES